MFPHFIDPPNFLYAASTVSISSSGFELRTEEL